MSELIEEPAIASWMTEDEVVFRRQAKEYLQKAADAGVLTSRKIDEVKVFADGETSVVFLVKSPELTYVAKLTRHPETVEREAVFFEKWAEQGVRIPRVLALHTTNDQIPVSIVSLEYIDAPILSRFLNTEQRVKKGVAREMGRTLASMHRAKGEGFGFPIPENRTKGNFVTFKEEFENTFLKRRANWLKEQGVITDQDLSSTQTAIEIIEKDLRSGIKPSLVHDDFRPYNIFASEPITVFDPNPRITHPFMCLALTLIKSEVESGTFGKQERDEILSGYSEITKVNNHVLSAAIVLRGLRTLNTWKRKDKEEKVSTLLELVRKHQQLIKQT